MMVLTDTSGGGPPTISAQWRERAEALADWRMSRVVVRRDVYGAYSADGGQFTAHGALTRQVLVVYCRGDRVIGGEAFRSSPTVAPPLTQRPALASHRSTSNIRPS